MASSTLVGARMDPDAALGEAAAEAILDSPTLKPVAILWWYHTDSETWRLLVGTRLAATKGPRAAYVAIDRSIRKAGLEDQLLLSHTWAVPDDHEIVTAIQQLATGGKHIRITHLRVNDVTIVDAYLLFVAKRRAGTRRRRS